MKKTIFWIFVLFFAWRIFIFLPLFASNYFLQDRKGYEYTQLKFYNDSSPKNIVNNFLISPWANFDGVAYLGIAGNGYTPGNARFFPVFPILVKGVSVLFGSLKPFEFGQVLVAFIISNVTFLVSLFVFYKLIRQDFSKKAALLSVAALLLFPTSFFFGSIYTESLFLLLSLLCFYFARKKLWVFAAIAGMLLSATRIVGIAMFPVLLWEFFKAEPVKKKQTWFKLIPLLFVPLGLLAFAWFNFHIWNDPLYFVHQQGEIRNGRSTLAAVFIPQTVFRYFKILMSVSPVSHFEWWISLLELSMFTFACIFLFIAWKKKIRFSYILFAILCFLIPASSGTFTGLPRYVAILFPMFMVLGLTKSKFVWIVYASVSIILLFLCVMYFSKGFFIA